MIGRPCARRRLRYTWIEDLFIPESRMIWLLLPSPYIQGETSLTSFRLASTAWDPGPMLQYGRDATTRALLLCEAVGPLCPACPRSTTAGMPAGTTAPPQQPLPPAPLTP